MPAAGLVMWFSLDKKSKVKHQGYIKIRMSFSADKISKVAIQEHKVSEERILRKEEKGQKLIILQFPHSI